MTPTASTYARRTMLVLYLTGVWLLLWGSLRPDAVLLGLLVAAGAVHWSRFPRVPLRTRVRLRLLPRLLLGFALDLVRSSAEVAVATVRTGRRTRSSVLALRLPHQVGDTPLMLACNRISLEPGTIVIDIDRHHDRLFIFQLDTPDVEAAERARDRAQALVDAVLAAFPGLDEAGGDRG